MASKALFHSIQVMNTLCMGCTDSDIDQTVLFCHRFLTLLLIRCLKVTGLQNIQSYMVLTRALRG